MTRLDYCQFMLVSQINSITSCILRVAVLMDSGYATKALMLFIESL
jgi:hypothetical protein